MGKAKAEDDIAAFAADYAEPRYAWSGWPDAVKADIVEILRLKDADPDTSPRYSIAMCRAWLKRRHGVDYNSNTIESFVRRSLGRKSWARP